MLTYQIRPRVFRHEPGRELIFPASCMIRFHFLPKQPFGMEPGGGRTTVHNKAAHVFFNLNTGIHWIQSDEPLQPLEVILDAPNRRLELNGNVLKVSERLESLKSLEDLIMSLYFGLPVLLNIDFADPPIVERVEGEVAEAPFRWELKEWRFPNDITDQDRQERRFAEACERLGLLADIRTRRVLAALHYFHVALRLGRSANTPGEFLAEVILNLSKTLEVLFPPQGDGRTRDAARSGLRALGLADAVIEAEYLPTMALRNEIDVGHVDLSIFTRDQLATIHAYVERTEDSFRTLLRTVLQAMAQGTWSPAAYEEHRLSAAAGEVVERLAARGSDAA